MSKNLSLLNFSIISSFIFSPFISFIFSPFIKKYKIFSFAKQNSILLFKSFKKFPYNLSTFSSFKIKLSTSYSFEIPFFIIIDIFISSHFLKSLQKSLFSKILPTTSISLLFDFLKTKDNLNLLSFLIELKTKQALSLI